MKKTFAFLFLTILLLPFAKVQSQNEPVDLQVKTANGILEGMNESGIRVFKGIPFAAPPVGELRWKEPQPVKNWSGVRKAVKFGPRAMQRPIFGDMGFRSDGVSEDCLYLNVWTSARSAKEQLPVLVYFYGGGMVAGDGSEPRYDGESMARKGIIAITVNYRLTIFGSFAHPELTKESVHHSSGNYGFLDQHAALVWVKQNIAAFGGNPNKITIAGESAGSFSVCAQMASPLSRDLIAGAIGESGSVLGTQPVASLSETEQTGLEFAKSIGANSLAELRAMPASVLLEATAKPGVNFPRNLDGYFLPKSPEKIFAAGEQAHVPLLVGWNSQESGFQSVMGRDSLTRENFAKVLQKFYGDKGAAVLKLYSGPGDDDVEQSATDLASDRFIGFGTWKWSDMQANTGGKPVYRYLYSRARPEMRSEMGNVVAGLAGGLVKSSDSMIKKTPVPRGAVHSAEIEYALGNLPLNRVYDWQAEDYKVSEIMQTFFANFIKTGNPNGVGLPVWPAVKSGMPAPVMHIDVETKVITEKNRERYLFLDKL